MRLQKLLVFPAGYGQRRKGPAKAWLPVLLILLAFALWISPVLRFRVLQLFDYPFHYKEYKHFGIRIPHRYRVHGIDVSRYQERVDWGHAEQMHDALRYAVYAAFALGVVSEQESADLGFPC